MYLKLYNTNVTPPIEVVLDESFLYSCEYRKQNDGKTVISVQKILAPGVLQTLEDATVFAYSLSDIKIELYSGDALLKSVRGAALSFSLQDRKDQQIVLERMDFLVGAKIVSGVSTSMGGSGASQLEYSPTVTGAEYNKSTGELMIMSDHLLHSIEGFTNTDFDSTKILVGTYRLAATAATSARQYTDHFRVTFKLTGDDKTAVDLIANTPGYSDASGVNYAINVEAGWNHAISEAHTAELSVVLASSLPTIARMIYDVPTAILTIFAQDRFSPGIDNEFTALDFDASRIIIRGHAFSYTNIDVIASGSSQAKFQIKGNCVDFMNEQITKSGTSDVMGVDYLFTAIAGWNGPTSDVCTGKVEMTGYVDFKAPAVPKNVTTVGRDQSIHVMSATANLETDLAGYNYYVDGVKQNAEPVNYNMYDITGLKNGKSYNITMTAIDVTGNESAKSTAIPTKPADSVPPTVPVGLTVTAAGDGVHVIWTANVENDIAGYNLYVDSALANVEPITDTAIDIGGLRAGDTHNFTLSAIDTSGNESSESAIVTFTV
jgi:hypothetical protein